MDLYIITFLAIFIYIIAKSKKSLHMLQQNLYNENNRYLRWIAKNLKQVFLIADIVAFIILVVAAILNNKISDLLYIVAIIIYLVSAFVIVRKKGTEFSKKPLVITKRVRRLIITLTIINILPTIPYFINNQNGRFSIVILSGMAVILYFISNIAVIINKPVEKLVYLYYYRMAQKKLKSMSKLNVIGITGSYGKTSSKNILNDILGIKFISCPTPKNLNTEYGLMITINNHLDKFDDVFIAEMGAYKKGEIKTLCNMVHPKYGILTVIGTAHLESFGSEKNIEDTKFELIESLPSDGIAVLNGDDQKQVNHKIKSDCKKLWIGITNKDADVVAENICYSYKGSNFDCRIKGEPGLYHFETKLLGNNNIYNILAGIALGKELGISIKELIQGVNKVKPVEHRLELKKLGNMYQIDDAYNSNPVGAKSALEVLKMMPGTKVVVTPEMIELGEKEEELNKIFGTQMKDCTDYVILIGKKRTKPIYDGLIESGFDKDKIIISNDVREAYIMINQLKSDKDIYALFENDLPDTYNE